MFDPEVKFEPRLAADCGIKNHQLFAPKRECDEQELKYLITNRPTQTFQKIESVIDTCPNRIIDPFSHERKPGGLVTLNLDTKDQQLAKAGFSLRVRYHYNADHAEPVRSVDMCIKTVVPSGDNVLAFSHTRGEWEVELPSVKPDMAKMISENLHSNPPLPAFFASGQIRDKDLFVESVGITLRETFTSFEMINNGTISDQTFAAVFQHTADRQNVFSTPYADVITRIDSEAEAEFTGFWGLKRGQLDSEQFEQQMRSSMRSLDSLLVSQCPGGLSRNTVSKANRARNALTIAYGDLDSGLSCVFNKANEVDAASRFALSQGIRAEDVNFNNVWHQIARTEARLEREWATRSIEPMRLVR